MLAADLNHRCAGLCFTKYPQNLLFAMPLLRYLQALLSTFREPRRTKTLNFRLVQFLGFGSSLPQERYNSWESVPKKEIPANAYGD